MQVSFIRRYLNHHHCPFPHLRLNPQLSSQYMRPLFHTAHAESFAVVVVHIHSDTVIFNCYGQTTGIFLYLNKNFRRLRMLKDIIQTLLHNAEEIDLILLCQRVVNIVDLCRELNAG